MFQFWPFKKKKAEPANTGPVYFPKTLLIVSISKSGELDIQVIPRSAESAMDEDVSGAEFCSLYSAITSGKLSGLIDGAIHRSGLTPNIQKKVLQTIGNISKREDTVDPRDVFPNV